jgi:hypothetical protein
LLVIIMALTLLVFRSSVFGFLRGRERVALDATRALARPETAPKVKWLKSSRFAASYGEALPLRSS